MLPDDTSDASSLCSRDSGEYCCDENPVEMTEDMSKLSTTPIDLLIHRPSRCAAGINNPLPARERIVSVCIWAAFGQFQTAARLHPILFSAHARAWQLQLEACLLRRR